MRNPKLPFALAWTLSLAACSAPIDVAIMTKLESGSLVGTSEVNAANLLLEDLGVKDVRIHAFDDAWDPAKSKEAFARVRERGIRFLVTSHTSTCAVAVAEDINAAGVLTMVTGAVTDVLSGKDDWILRDVPDVLREQAAMAAWVRERGFRRILVLRDMDNAAYVEPALRVFRAALPGVELTDIDLRLSALDMEELGARMDAAGRGPAGASFDLCYVLVGGYKSAAGTLAQLARSRSPGCAILFTPWMKTPAIVETAGAALEGAWMASHYPPRTESPGVNDYIERYKRRFGYAPTYISLNVYRALSILVDAFRAGARDPAAVKRHILEAGSVATALGSVRFDATGDAEGGFYMLGDIAREF